MTIDAGGSKATLAIEWDLGLNNPAGLDMRPQVITMTLAALRYELHFQRREFELAHRAFRDLAKWEEATANDRFTKSAFYLMWFSQVLGPLYTMGDYVYLIDLFEIFAENMQMTRAMQSTATLGTMGLYKRLFVTDARRFATALEYTSNRFLYASSLVRVGEVDKGQQNLDEMLKDPEIRDMGNIYWATLYERARISLGKGQREQAKRYLQQAADAIEQVRSTISFEAGRIGFATSKQAVYAALVGVLAEAGDWSGAFLVAERAKARALVDLLAKMHDVPPPPQASEQVRRLMASAESGDTAMGFGLGEQAEHTRNLSGEALRDLGQAAPEAGSLMSVPSVPLNDIAGRLEPGETLVDYFLAGESLYALVMNGTAVTGVKLPAQDLAEQIRAFRMAIEAGEAAQAQGRALYDRLIRPLQGSIQGQKLTLCPHGALHYVPFAALLDGQQYLIDRYSVRVMPSASALVYLKTDKPQKAGKVLALGNPDLGDAKYDLPNAQAEAEQVAQMYPDSRALVRGQASKAAVRDLGGSFAILHFASHASFDADAPLASGLYLARGGEADGRLTVRELYGMRLDAQLVTLSACQTGLGKVLSGDEVIGLTRGFLYAGARTIVSSLWSVQDRATAELMIHFYRNLAGHDQREALRLAQIATRADHPAPLYWAAFQITGSAN